jgi:Flp pilus assembly protein TadG
MSIVDDRGSAPTEVALVAPLLIVLLLFVIFVGRLTSTRLDVTAAARDAARAASLRATPDEAAADARRTAERVLADKGVGCRELLVDVDTESFAPGGSVGVSVSCTANLADLALLRVPGTRAISASAREVIDAYGVRS